MFHLDCSVDIALCTHAGKIKEYNTTISMSLYYYKYYRHQHDAYHCITTSIIVISIVMCSKANIHICALRQKQNTQHIKDNRVSDFSGYEKRGCKKA